MPYYLKKQDGYVYGPVALDVLAQWAADGRIVPEDSLSTDRASWSPAAETAELGMVWMLELGGARYGPLHALSLRELVRDGAIAPDHELVHRESGEKTTLLRALLDAMNGQVPAAAPERAAGGANEDELETIRLKEELEAERSAAGRLREELERLKTQAEERERKLSDQLAEATSKEIASRSARDELRRKVAELEGRLGPDPGGASTDISAYSELSASYDRLVEQLTARTAELKSAQEARALVHKESDERVRMAEDRVRRLQEESDELRRKLAELTDSHVQLVKAYRDLNDRFIRSRQTQPGAAPAEPKAPPKTSTGFKIKRV